MVLKNRGKRFSLLALQMSMSLRLLCVVAVLGSTVGLTSTATACPMCKIAHEDALDPSVAARPKAYMYSILFMLAMPAGLATTFGVTFYRLSKKQQELNEQLNEQWLDQHRSQEGGAGESSSET